MGRLAYEWRIARRTVQRALNDGVVDLASSIAFFAAFAIFPLLLAVIPLSMALAVRQQARLR